MAWNDDNNKNPWGGNNQTPPELDEVIKDFKNKFNTRFGGGSSGQGGVSKAAIGSFKYAKKAKLRCVAFPGDYHRSGKYKDSFIKVRRLNSKIFADL